MKNLTMAFVAIFALACDPDDSSNPTNDAGTADSSSVRTCQEVASDYEVLTTGVNFCGNDNDCQVLYGACGVGLGGCHIVTNQSVSQRDINSLADEHVALSCGGPVCRCTAPPKAACIRGMCTGLYTTPIEVGKIEP